MLGRLCQAARQLACIAIADAHADQKKIAKALKEFVKGENTQAAGDWTKAIDHYKEAWKTVAGMIFGLRVSTDQFS